MHATRCWWPAPGRTWSYLWVWAVMERCLLIAALVITSGVGTARATGPTVRVMTRNVYLGADLAPALAAADVGQLALAASAIWLTVQATNFPERAKVLANEIQGSAPTLIGLQEVALWRTGPLDGPPSLGGTPATTVVYDFLQSLLDELGALGIPYDAVVVQEESDIEAPTVLGIDVRLTQRDVILAKAGLPPDALALANPQSAHFTSNLTLPIAGGITVVTVTRGWVGVDVVAHGRAFRFLNTHLEAFSNFHRTAQAFELLSGPLNAPGSVVMVGDLNSAPDDPPFSEPSSPYNSTNPYDVLVGAGFVDAWVLRNGGASGFTCCNQEDLLNPTPTLDTRIDHVLVRPAIDVMSAVRVGLDPNNRTPDGLWPSDHAGVVAMLAFQQFTPAPALGPKPLVAVVFLLLLIGARGFARPATP